MNALLNEKVQMVSITVGPRLIYLFTQTKKSTYFSPLDASGYSLEELVDSLIDLKYKLVDARYFRDPGITGNFRLMFYSSDHAPKENIPGAAQLLTIARGFAGAQWNVSMAYTPYRGSKREDEHTVLNIHLIPRHSILAIAGLRILRGWSRLSRRLT